MKKLMVLGLMAFLFGLSVQANSSIPTDSTRANPAAISTGNSATGDTAITALQGQLQQENLNRVAAEEQAQKLRDSLTTIRNADSARLGVNKQLSELVDSLANLRTAFSLSGTEMMRRNMNARSTRDMEMNVMRAESLLTNQLHRLEALQSTYELTHKVDELKRKEVEDARPGSLVEQGADLAAKNLRHRQQAEDLDRMASAEAERIQVEREKQSLERETKRLRSNFTFNPYVKAGFAGGSSKESNVTPAVMGGLGAFCQVNPLKVGAGFDLWAEAYSGPGPNGEGVNWWTGAAFCYPIIYEPRGFQSWAQIGARFTDSNTLEAVVGVRLKAASWGLTFRVIPQNERIVELGLELSLPPQ